MRAVNLLSFRRLPLLPLLLLALSGTANAFVNPAPQLLPHGVFSAQGAVGYPGWPYTTQFSLGLFNAMEVGVGYGDGWELTAKAWLRDQDGLIPAIAVGGRNIVTNTEAVFYGVPKGAGRDSLENEVYGSLGWNWKQWTVFGGASIFPRANDNQFEPFWTLSFGPGAGFEFSYEGFMRTGKVLNNFEASWSWARTFRLSVGATQPWGHGNGYEKKRLYAEVQLMGRLINTVWPNMRSELDSATAKLAAQDARIAQMEARMGSLDAIYAEMWADYGDTLTARNRARTAQFDSIVALYGSDSASIEDIRTREAVFMAQGKRSTAVLEKIAFDRLEADARRVVAVRMMGNSKDSAFVSPLSQILAADGSEALHREAVLALANIGTESAFAALSAAQLKLSGTARETADQILGSF
jgi:hypothetical protein